MKHVIIGTAGHVDHGKTLLIKALTGIDTDRLAEEKKRGITIELGFAHLTLDDGVQAGIVDVPGHEKFIRNMLMGAGGIDLAMLIVAGDEGFMPQTIEHLDILSLLGLKDGLVVITKKDLCDPDWLEVVQEDVRDRVKGTFLENKPIVTVSSYTGEGIPELRALLTERVRAAQDKDPDTPFRLPVDRVFSMEGFGTVVTGTLIEGSLHVGDSLTLYPGGLTAKVRGLQVHSESVDTAYAGQRVAVNLTGVKKEDLSRGVVLARPDSMADSLMADATLRLLATTDRTVKTGSTVHLHHGSNTRLAKVVLLDTEELFPGDSAPCQLRFSEPLAMKPGDPFVIRFYSPVETIGGGIVLDGNPKKHKRNAEPVLNNLKALASPDAAVRLLTFVEDMDLTLPTENTLMQRSALKESDLQAALHQLLADGSVLPACGGYVAKETLQHKGQEATVILADYHEKFPLSPGLARAELRQKIVPHLQQNQADEIFALLETLGFVKLHGDAVSLPDFTVNLSPKLSALRDALIQDLTQAHREGPSPDELFAGKSGSKADLRHVLESIFADGTALLLSPTMVVIRKAFEESLQVLKAHFAAQDSMTLAEFRDAMGVSRKYALGYLEYFDREKITKKVGDARVKGPQFVE